jgi:glycosyltransferase involved in cell wall biosynthesis
MVISVVIPCYNVERHIEDVLRDVPEYVSYIIAVNDCSTDNTACTLKRLQEAHPRRPSQAGLYQSRNQPGRGWRHAYGVSEIDRAEL